MSIHDHPHSDLRADPRFAVLPGSPFPLGATVVDEGVNFAVFSEHAQRAFVCLYDGADPSRETARYELSERTAQVFHGLVPDIRAGTLYGFRMEGPFAPSEGQRFNINKLLIDPYARALHGDLDFKGAIYGYPVGAPEGDLAFSDQDDAASKPKGVVLADTFDWGDDQRPNVPWNDTIIYEAHVRGLTMRHPEIPEEIRGTYAAVAHPAIISHLTRLGITAIELLPVHAKTVDGYMIDRGLTNYWGYSPMGYFAPEQRYARATTPGAQVAEFKTMVKKLHAAGIEVILDVVYNHTGEGNQLGPTFSFRGLDNVAYYHHSPEDRRYNMEFTGCGNSLNLGALYTMKLVVDSLRYWATEMRVDGFRFDLASTLGRMWPSFAFDRNAAFFQAVHQDPVLSMLKLIAEPWDTGDGGQQLGGFPVLWSEWNGSYRDVVREFWKGDEHKAGELGYRLTGSADIFQPSGRRPHASINFVTAHDGFTLHDLVSYDHKHNEDNKEDGHDGNDNNRSWNHGAEGETDDQAINELRDRTKRNFLTTLFVSRGVPMLLAGDEMGRTQRGNNNAYCQDNDISWVDWKLDSRRRALLDFTARLSRLRRKEGVLREDHFFRGDRIWDSGSKDLAFFRPDGSEMPPEAWDAPWVRSFAYLLGGDTLVVPDKAGHRPMGNTLLVLLNANHEDVVFTLPRVDWGQDWEVVVDTAVDVAPRTANLTNDAQIPLRARSMVVLRRPPPGAEEI
ncbi:MAG: glycogen debranching protein GlgX [Pseudomonadota bacterium]